MNFGSHTKKSKQVGSLATDRVFVLLVITKGSVQGFQFQIKTGDEGQCLTCRFGWPLPAQFNWDQVIAQKAPVNTLSSVSVTPALLVRLTLFVKSCHNGVCHTEGNNLDVITQSNNTKP